MLHLKEALRIAIDRHLQVLYVDPTIAKLQIKEKVHQLTIRQSIILSDLFEKAVLLLECFLYYY